MARIRTIIVLLGISLGLPLAALAQSQDTVIYYHLDATGSVRAITDANGGLLGRYDFEPFGIQCGSACGTGTPPETIQFQGKERDTDTQLDYFGARYYEAVSGRFATVDPGHVNGNLLDPQSWNGYAYARNNPLKHTDPTGTEYEICVYGASGYGGSCGSVSDQYFAILYRSPGAGIQLWGGAIFAGNKVVGYYKQTSVDPTLDSFIRQTGQLAAAELKYGLIGMGVAAGGGALAGWAVGAAGTTSGLVTLSGETGWDLIGNQALNQAIGSVQRELLRTLFKQGRLPPGLTRETLKIYRELAKRAIEAGKDDLGVQAERLRLIEEALKVVF